MMDPSIHHFYLLLLFWVAEVSGAHVVAVREAGYTLGMMQVHYRAT